MLLYMDFTSWAVITLVSLLVALIWWFVICKPVWPGPNKTLCNCPPRFICTWVLAWLGSWLGTPVIGRWGPAYGVMVSLFPALLGGFMLIILFCCICKCLKEDGLQPRTNKE